MSETNEIMIMAHPQMDPMVCKFVIDREIFAGSYNCDNKEKAQGSPLLEELFKITGITQVMVAGNAITVAKSAEQPWQVIGKDIGATIRSLIQSETKLFSDELKKQQEAASQKDEMQVIQKLLDTQINPAVSMHGGHVSLLDVKDNIAYVELSGGCQGCGMAHVTLKQGIEVAIKEAVPSIVAVYDNTDHAGGQNPYYQPSGN